MSAPASSFYARPATTSAELVDAAVWRCTAAPLDETAVGHPPPGATSALLRRRFELRDCTQLRGAATAAPTVLTGFTLLAPSQRHDDPAAPSLELDGQRFFDGAATGPILLWVGGPALVAPMGFEGNSASVEGAPARAIALTGADAALSESWREFAGWTKAATATGGHPLIALDALRVALAGDDASTAKRLLALLDAEGQPAPVRTAARAAADERPAR